MKILITGACGFIGSHVAEALLKRGDTVVGIDNFNDFYSPAIKRQHAAMLKEYVNFHLIEGSILDPKIIEIGFSTDFDTVLHLAAYAGVRPSIEDPALYARENIGGTIAVMDACRAKKDKPRLVIASSSSVYGGLTHIPFNEEDSVNTPISPYAATKRACEILGYTYHQLWNLDIAMLRFFTVYGPRQRPEMAIHKFAELMIEGKPVPRYGNGRSARDYTYIDDIVKGVLGAIDKSRGYKIYNLGNSRTITLNELILKLGQALNITPAIQSMPNQPGDVEITCADISRASKDLGYSPDFPFEKGIKIFADWFLEQRKGAK